MLREESVAYSSLPQDEGTTPSSNFISRPANSAHNQRDFKLATILTVGVIVAGLGLAATLPFILRGTPKVTANVDKSSGDKDKDDFWTSHLNAGKGANTTIDDKKEDSHVISSAVATTAALAPATADVVTSEEPKPTDVIPDTQAHVKPKPVLVTFDKVSSAAEAIQQLGASSFKGDKDGGGNVSSAVSWTSTEKADSKRGNEPDDGETPAGGIDEGDDESDGVPEAEENKDAEGGSSETATGEVNDGSGVSGESLIPSQGGSMPQNVTPKSEMNEHDIDMYQLMSAIYGEDSEGGGGGGSLKPTTTDNSWMSNMVSTQDKVTLVILAGVVAVALAVVIAGVGWLIHTRIAARRRRINIQNVITDLQSRDKVVLLNSESEEE